MMNRRN